MKYILIALISFNYSYLNAQSHVGGPLKWGHILSSLELRNQENAIKEVNPNSVSDLYKKYGGSPFLFSKPQKGSLVTKKGDLIENIQLMYDAYGNELFYIDEGREVVLKKHLIEEMILEIKGDAKSYKRANPEKPDRFYEVLFEDDKVSFIKDHKIQISEGRNNGMVVTDSKFVKSINYYLVKKTGRGSINLLNLRKKNILSILPSSRKRACIKYMDSQKKFKLKSVESYIDLLSNTKQIKS